MLRSAHGQAELVVTRHRDVLDALRTDALSSDRTVSTTFLREAAARGHHPDEQMRSMLVLDPPEHTRLRKLVNKAFTARRCSELEPRLREIAAGLLEGARRPRTPIELVSGFALPFPARAIAELLGIAPDHHERFCSWSSALTAPLVGRASADALVRAERASRELGRFLLREVAARRRSPRDDLVAALVEARDEDDRLSDAELLAMLRLLLVAGHETTTRLIGTGVAMLLADGAAWQGLREDPGAIESAVEELARLATPIRAIARFPDSDVELCGRTLPRGSQVTLRLDAANRDPEVFDDPETLQIHREPNPHLSFGFGIHFCLGAALARLETRIALETLLERSPSLRLVDREPAWISSSLVCGLRQLQLEHAA